VKIKDIKGILIIKNEIYTDEIAIWQLKNKLLTDESVF